MEVQPTDVGVIVVHVGLELHQSAGSTFGRQRLYHATATVEGEGFENYGATKRQAVAGLGEWMREAGLTGTLRVDGTRKLKKEKGRDK